MPEDEFDWIKDHTPENYNHKGLIEGIGDDAAVYGYESDYDEILCVDTMIEGVHFKKQTMSPEDIGHKALAVNISDIAAMGGIPVYYIVSIALPADWSDEELSGIYQGMNDLGQMYCMDMIGGDTVSSPHDLMISVTVHGRVEKGCHLVRRSAAPGDIVFLTNPTGRSAAGLQLLLQRGREAYYSEIERELLSYHQKPVPRVDAGRVISALHVSASLNDISDGLASEVNELAEASNVSIELYKSQIPIAEELHSFADKSFWDWIFYGGEDFELVGTITETAWPMLQKNMAEQGLTIYQIGRVKEGAHLVTLLDGEQKITLEKQGYNHFK
ncbi:thiamine-phosphate kinase [Salibacterium salarium]|uniref:Thiamine-monophosphate kinase n=1 Tax=Salibacterium salarium TaxID=284579 RepID=A0A428MX48_9BACI|nr:thiamine-phosphate kinase [Salibacterium salarium]RSL30664.1 thiamine-phosphate kinase [Salibacterium salarium]